MLRLIPLFLSAFFLLPTAQARQAADYQDTPGLPSDAQGRRIQALIDAMNADDPDGVQAFITGHTTPEFAAFAPMARHQEIFRSFRRRTGGVDVYGLRHYTPPREETVVILRDRLYGGWQAFTIGFDADQEGRINGLNFSGARPPSDLPAVTMSREAMIGEARALLARGCEADVFSGTALIARGDEVLLEYACGEASKRFHVPNNIDTRFNLGSMNKMFTAVAIAQLAEAGTLSFDDPISRWVDASWLPQEITDRVTVHHLLTHTSGLGSYFNDTFMESSRARFRAVDDYTPLVVGDTLAFEPGARFRYSNTGMLLLGVVIEKASGMNYFDYIRRHVYEPAGMTASDSYPMDEPVENLAIGYSPAPETPTGWRNNLFQHVLQGGPAGGGFSTVRDLHRFARALQTGRLVSEAALERMWTNHSDAGYGYGFMIAGGPAGRVVGHGGGFSGISANLDVFLDRGYVVAILSNYDRGATPVAGRLAELLGSVPHP